MRRTSPLLSAGLLLLAAAGCGGSEREVGTGGATQQPTDGSPTTTEPGAPVGPPTLADVGLEPPEGCDPWLPVHAVAGVYGGQPTVVGVEPPNDGTIDPLERRFQAPDTDGDGTPDTVDYQSVHLAVTRGDGTVTLARDGAVVGPAGGQTWIGDLDGDGRDEILVYASDPQQVGPLELYVVPGSVPAGTHEPADVGVLLPWQPNTLMWAVGDLDRDGADDVLVPGEVGAIVVSGAALLAPGPGGRVDAAQLESLLDAPTGFLGVLELADGAPPVFVTATDVGGDPETRIQVELATDPPLHLRIGHLPAVGGGWGSFGTIGGYRSGEDRIVTYRFDGGRSGYVGTWYWNLDDPCAEPAPTPAAAPDTGTAPLAGPQSVAQPALLPATS